MTDNEISKALALAIGWELVDSTKGFLRDEVEVWVRQRHYDSDWRIFSYKDWSVVGPIAERYDAFPYLNFSGGWTVGSTLGAVFDTPQKAIALAVIGAHRD